MQDLVVRFQELRIDLDNQGVGEFHSPRPPSSSRAPSPNNFSGAFGVRYEAQTNRERMSDWASRVEAPRLYQVSVGVEPPIESNSRLSVTWIARDWPRESRVDAGCFNLNPAPGESIIGRNYGRGRQP